jgi:hypothetical protein
VFTPVNSPLLLSPLFPWRWGRVRGKEAKRIRGPPLAERGRVDLSRRPGRPAGRQPE